MRPPTPIPENVETREPDLKLYPQDEPRPDGKYDGGNLEINYEGDRLPQRMRPPSPPAKKMTRTGPGFFIDRQPTQRQKTLKLPDKSFNPNATGFTNKTSGSRLGAMSQLLDKHAVLEDVERTKYDDRDLSEYHERKPPPRRGVTQRLPPQRSPTTRLQPQRSPTQRLPPQRSPRQRSPTQRLLSPRSASPQR